MMTGPDLTDLISLAGARRKAAALQRFMAERAGARRAMEIPGASHAAAVSHPEETADLILQATALPATA